MENPVRYLKNDYSWLTAPCPSERVINNKKAGLLENRSIVENISYMENSIRQEQVEAGFINNSSPRGRTRY